MRAFTPLSLLLLLLGLSLPGTTQAQAPVQPMRWAQAKEIIANNESELLIVNFWATWCVPCVRELPAFQQVADEYRDQGVRLLLVSLDFEEDMEKRVLPFVQNKGLQEYEILLITNDDANAWLGQVDESWSGAIPATLLVDNQGNYLDFHEAMMTYDELKEFIHPYL